MAQGLTRPLLVTGCVVARLQDEGKHGGIGILSEVADKGTLGESRGRKAAGPKRIAH